MSNIFCKNCYYLTSKLDKDFPLDDYYTEWGCSFHSLYNGEVRWPSEQRCDDFLSQTSRVRNEKIETIIGDLIT